MKKLRMQLSLSDGRPLPFGVGRELSRLCRLARTLHGWEQIPATSGNMSIRRGELCLISRSGVHKSLLTSQDFLPLSLSGVPLHPISGRPSDETAIHLEIYRLCPSAGCVVHFHPHQVNTDAPGLSLTFKGHELLKAAGAADHETPVELVAMENSQDMQVLVEELQRRLAQGGNISFPSQGSGAIVLKNHGIYVFSSCVKKTLNLCEMIRYLFENRQYYLS